MFSCCATAGPHLKFQVVQWPCHWPNQTKSKKVSFRTFKRRQSKPTFCADYFLTNKQGAKSHAFKSYDGLLLVCGAKWPFTQSNPEGLRWKRLVGIAWTVFVLCSWYSDLVSVPCHHSSRTKGGDQSPVTQNDLLSAPTRGGQSLTVAHHRIWTPIIQLMAHHIRWCDMMTWVLESNLVTFEAA